MLKVNKSVCLGCGLCTRVCPQGAIRVIGGKAQIDVRRCIRCYQCVNICPQGAILELVAVSPEELKTNVSNLKRRADAVIQRIDKLVVNS
mgnify:CR=1 FL=1